MSAYFCNFWNTVVNQKSSFHTFSDCMEGATCRLIRPRGRMVATHYKIIFPNFIQTAKKGFHRVMGKYSISFLKIR